MIHKLRALLAIIIVMACAGMFFGFIGLVLFKMYQDLGATTLVVVGMIGFVCCLDWAIKELNL